MFSAPFQGIVGKQGRLRAAPSAAPTRCSSSELTVPLTLARKERAALKEGRQGSPRLRIPQGDPSKAIPSCGLLRVALVCSLFIFWFTRKTFLRPPPPPTWLSLIKCIFRRKMQIPEKKWWVFSFDAYTSVTHFQSNQSTASGKRQELMWGPCYLSGYGSHSWGSGRLPEGFHSAMHVATGRISSKQLGGRQFRALCLESKFWGTCCMPCATPGPFLPALRASSPALHPSDTWP